MRIVLADLPPAKGGIAKAHKGILTREGNVLEVFRSPNPVPIRIQTAEFLLDAVDSQDHVDHKAGPDTLEPLQL
jgi:hypothetical protein